jgi:aminomethyltransferase
MTAELAQLALQKTALCDWHAAHGGRMVDFAGWLMPVQYTSIVEEHHATRQAIGLFDVSHMGRIDFTGPGACDFLDRLVTRDVKSLARGQVRYTLVTNEAGGILDDVLVYHLAEHAYGDSYYQLVVNASNRAKILAWIDAQSPDDNGVEIEDRTLATAMIAVQGPKAIEAVKPLSSVDPSSLKYFTGVEAKLGGVPGLIGRTGYTGEDGWEIIIPADVAVDIWKSLIEHGAAAGAKPAGLGCRDTLRLEAAMPLYGHELNEEINPYQAGLGFAVNLDGRDFPGRDVLAKIRDDLKQPKRVGLELSGKRVPREHYVVLSGNEHIGEVTSGTFSPTLDRPIAMAYVAPQCAELGSEITIDIRGKREPARVVKLPFYKRAK